MTFEKTSGERNAIDTRIRAPGGPFGRTRLEVEEAAKLEDLWPMSDDHWRVIQFVRAYTRDNRRVPALVRVARATGFRLNRLEQLFPHGPIPTALRLLGLDLPFDLLPGCPFVSEIH